MSDRIFRGLTPFFVAQPAMRYTEQVGDPFSAARRTNAPFLDELRTVSQPLFSRDSSSTSPLSNVDMSSIPPAPPPPPPPDDESGYPVGHSSDSPGRPAAAQASQPRAKRAIPPPPPPRATLAPVRPTSSEPVPKSGIGSAKTRWRGTLPEIRSAAPQSSPVGQRATDIGGAEDGDSADTVTRSAPSWLLSLVIHLIVLLVLALITTPAGNGFTKLVLDMGISKEDAEDAFELDLSTPEFVETVEAPVDAIDDALVETEIPDLFETIQPTDPEIVQPDILGTESIQIEKPMFAGRRGAMRRALMAMFGATEQTQEAVKLGLAWLKRQQHRTGYWSLRGPYSNGAVSENRCAATAMALLAFAGDGNTHLSGPYRTEVDLGVKYLVGLQDRGGFMAGEARGNEKTYAQAQATIALCELYGMTKDSWLRAYAQRAVDYALKAQHSGGGWRYRPNEPGDTSVTGWYVMALQSAIAADLEVHEGKVNLIGTYLDSASVYGGSAYAYQPGRSDATPAMTAEGLLCRQYLGWPREHPGLIEGMNLLFADAPFSVDDQNVYYWYYATQVFHHYGGKYWRDWNDEMKVKLPALQIKEGSERGSWAPQRDRWSIGGRLYTTCLSLYCLEVYYRHMPLYNHSNKPAG